MKIKKWFKRKMAQSMIPTEEILAEVKKRMGKAKLTEDQVRWLTKQVMEDKVKEALNGKKT